MLCLIFFILFGGSLIKTLITRICLDLMGVLFLKDNFLPFLWLYSRFDTILIRLFCPTSCALALLIAMDLCLNILDVNYSHLSRIAEPTELCGFVFTNWLFTADNRTLNTAFDIYICRFLLDFFLLFFFVGLEVFLGTFSYLSRVNFLFIFIVIFAIIISWKLLIMPGLLAFSTVTLSKISRVGVSVDLLIYRELVLFLLFG